MSSNSKKEAAIKVFGMTNQLITEDLSRVAREQEIELGHTVLGGPTTEEQQYYSQFDRAVRKEASEMARHYQIFYCLEKSIRELISDTLEDAEGASWWDGSRITPHLQGEVKKRIKREKDSGMTVRSEDPLDFTTFGELSGIITGNWDLFGGILTSPKAVERIMGNLNSLRGPIAHCSPLAEDEVLRLQLSLRDWFRQME
ncbi:MAG: hypothetical protein KDN19_11935 [Verrucomicrobiae bacterium]|nr:hypothetical protein [Verrucomicrobiae bacterium]